MVSNIIWQWIITAVFGILAIFFLYKSFVVKGFVTKVSYFLHFVMSVGMLAMSWPWWNIVPARVQLVFFALATLWYLVIAYIGLKNGKYEFKGTNAHSVVHQVSHAIMMASMAWMLWSMSGESTTHSDSHHSEHIQDHTHGHGANQGHDLEPTQTMEQGHGSHSLMHEPAVFIAGIVVTLMLAVVTLWFLYEALKSKKSSHDSTTLKAKSSTMSRVDMAANSLMGAGMVLMNLLMYWPEALG